MDYQKRQHRRRQYNEPGHAHELTFCCYKRFKFLAAERTCEWLAEELNNARKKCAFHLWAYVFMPEHVHLIVYPLHANYEIESILKAIKEPVGRRAIKYLHANAPEWIPRITRRRGQRTERCFGQSGGGFDSNTDEPRVLADMIDYVHLNPVRRGLVERACDWKWSSAGWFEGKGGNGLAPDPIPAEWIETVSRSAYS
jgi:putative transposase